MTFISDLPFVDVGIDYNHYIRPTDRHGLVVNTHFYALPPYTTSPTSSSQSSTGGEDGSNHPDQEMFISDLEVVDVDIDYNYYTRPSDPNGMTANIHFRDLPPFTESPPTSPLSPTSCINTLNNGDLETVRPSSFSSSKKLEPLKHPNAVAAYSHIMSGVLASAVIDRKETYEGDRIFIPDAGHTHGQIKRRERRKWPYSDRQDRLEASKKFLFCTATAIPRLLFRGFHSKSGGGLDPRLNSKTGVMPHAFLDGEGPAAMWDVHNLQNELTGHLGQNKQIRSHFSSWSQMLHMSLLFALRINVRKPKFPMLAVLDTESITERVWYTPDLHASGLAGRQYKCEYHVYGPVSGPKYHCVPVRKLLSIPGSRAIMWAPVPRPFKYVVHVARKIAKVLRPANGTLDTILMLTAKFVGYHFERTKDLQTFSYPRLGGFLYHVRDILQALSMRSDARYISLAVPNASTECSAALVLELQMLLAAENAVHILGWTWEAASSRIYHPYRRKQRETYCRRMSVTTRKRKWSTVRNGRPLKRQRVWTTRKRKGSTIPDDRPLKRQRLS